MCTYGFTAYAIGVGPAFYHLGEADWAYSAQTAAITITFPQPVYNVQVGNEGVVDAINCDDLGSVSFTGVHSGAVPFELDFEDRCDNPSHASTVAYTPQPFGRVGGVSQVTINPMSPMVWQYVEPNAPPWDNIRTKVGRALWVISWDETPSASWGPLTVDCPTGDSILDLQATRDLLKALWDSSRADLPPSQRREFKGGVFQDWNTGAFSWVPFEMAISEPCRSAGAPPPGTQGKFILGAHTHPAAPGEPIACDPTMPSKMGRYRPAFGGPSPEDFSTAASEFDNGAIAHLIMDSKRIYRILPGADSTNFVSKVLPVARQGSGCSRP